MEAITSPVGAPATYKPSEILRMVDTKASAVLADLGTLGFLQVEGVLGPVHESRYPMVYGVGLRDATGGGDPLPLDIPKTLKPESLAGKDVEAGGFLVAKKGLHFSLQVSRLAAKAGTSAGILAAEKSLRDIFLHPTSGPSKFPDAESFAVTCIHGKASQVLADFENQLHGLDLDLDMDRIPVNLQSPEELAGAIEKASGDVVVLIRGGGNDGDFEVFNRPQVLEAWRALDAHKVSALGHTQHSTMLDRFSHKVCDTPTAAGAYIKAGANEARYHWYVEQKAAQSDKNLTEALKQSNADWEKRMVTAQQAALAHIATLQKQAARAAKLPSWVWPALLAAASMGAAAGAVLGTLVAWHLK